MHEELLFDIEGVLLDPGRAGGRRRRLHAGEFADIGDRFVRLFSSAVADDIGGQPQPAPTGTDRRPNPVGSTV